MFIWFQLDLYIYYEIIFYILGAFYNYLICHNKPDVHMFLNSMCSFKSSVDPDQMASSEAS